MRRLITALAVITILPAPALGNSLTFDIWPSANPMQSTSCALRLAGGMITAVEVQGTGMPPQQPMRWPASPEEIAALMAALQALVSGDLPSVETYTSRLPAPPYITVNWMARVDDGMLTGLYIQKGLTLPLELTRVLDGLTPGGPCTKAVR
jgi:hypothetical protein